MTRRGFLGWLMSGAAWLLAASRRPFARLSGGVLGTFTHAGEYDLPSGVTVIEHGLPAKPDMLWATPMEAVERPLFLRGWDTKFVVIVNPNAGTVRCHVVIQVAHSLIR